MGKMAIHCSVAHHKAQPRPEKYTPQNYRAMIYHRQGQQTELQMYFVLEKGGFSTTFVRLQQMEQ